MIHDEKHELAQDEAMRLIAGAIASVAGHLGMVQPVRDVQKAIAMLNDDEAAEPEPVAAPEAPKAELHVTPPSVDMDAAVDALEPDWAALSATEGK